jgi:uncharacterized membrane protein
MTYCQNCGSPVEGRYCAKCGAATGQDAGATLEQPATPPPPGTDFKTMSANVASALCYIPLLGGIVFLLMEPYNRNKLIRFHAFQALYIFGAIFLLNIVLTTFIEIFWSFWGMYRLLRLAYFALWAYMGYKAYMGEKVVLPVIGPLAEKQA